MLNGAGFAFPQAHMSHSLSLNSLKGSCIGDYMGNHDTGYSGDTKSLDPTP